MVIALPDPAVVSDEENLTENKAVFPDAAREIEIHFSPVESDEVPTTSVPKIKRSLSKVKMEQEKRFFFYHLYAKRLRSRKISIGNYWESH